MFSLRIRLALLLLFVYRRTEHVQQMFTTSVVFLLLNFILLKIVEGKN